MANNDETNSGGNTYVNNGADGSDYYDQKAPPGPGTWPRAGIGTPGKDSGKSCGTKAGTGKAGLPGKTGIAGAKGGPGKAANQVKLVFPGEMTGTYVCQTNGGKGGGGQQGGPGGTGQDGGPGGVKSSHCGTGPVGQAGPGGLGGNGGDAGTGGDAGQIYISYKNPRGVPPPVIKASVNPGVAGKANNAGGGGAAGKGDGGGGSLGGGKHGKNADGGKGGQIYVNGKIVPPS